MIELLSILLVLLLGLVTSYEDINGGKIRNKWTALAILVGLAIFLSTSVYYYTAGKLNIYYTQQFVSNFLLSAIIGIFIWLAKLWSAADAKLFISFATLIPLSYYANGYVSYFPSLSLLINTFTPIFLVLLLLTLRETNRRQKADAFKSFIQPTQLINSLLMVFGFSWLVSLPFKMLGLSSSFGFSMLLTFILMRLLASKKGGDSVAILASIGHLLFEFGTVFSLSYLSQLAFSYITIVFGLYFLGILANTFTGLVFPKDLKAGMVVAGEELTAENIVNLRKKPHDALRVSQTLPFAPYLFAGALLTLLAKGSLFTVLGELIKRFI